MRRPNSWMIEIHAINIINPQSVDNTVTLSIGAPDTKGLQLLQSWKRLRKAPDWKAAEYLASSRLGIGASPSCVVLGAWIFGQVCYHLLPLVGKERSLPCRHAPTAPGVEFESGVRLETAASKMPRLWTTCSQTFNAIKSNQEQSGEDQN